MERDTVQHVPVDTGGALWPHLFEPFRNMASSVANFFSPKADAASAEAKYEINMELPGISADDIDISLNDHVLTIRGEKKHEHEEKTKTYYFTERSYGAFQRSFRLPGDVDTGGISADFNDGVLKLTLPRLQSEPPRQKKISIRAN